MDSWAAAEDLSVSTGYLSATADVDRSCGLDWQDLVVRMKELPVNSARKSKGMRRSYLTFPNRRALRDGSGRTHYRLLRMFICLSFAGYAGNKGMSQ